MNLSVSKSILYRVIQFVLNITFWLSFPVTGAAILLTLIRPNGFSFMLSLDGICLSKPITVKTNLYPELSVLFLLSIVSGILSIWFLREIVNSLEFGSPFAHANVVKIRAMGWTLLFGSYTNELLIYLYLKNVDKGASPLIQPQFNPIPWDVFLALFILVLAEIFRFGCTLQHEHDTTV